MQSSFQTRQLQGGASSGLTGDKNRAKTHGPKPVNLFLSTKLLAKTAHLCAVCPNGRQNRPQLTFSNRENHQTKGDDRFWPPQEMKMGEEYNPLQDWRRRL